MKSCFAIFSRRWLATLLFAFAASAVQAETLLIAVGAGYKRPVGELATTFEKQSGIKLEQSYGHMGAVVSQAKQSGQIAVIFGDLSYLEQSATGLDFASFIPVGIGRLVVAWPKGSNLNAASDLIEPRFARIALPDTKSAIYGIAATQFLRASGLESHVADRLRVVATVPQVSAYLIAGEVDAGFINLTEALANREKIGGYLEIDRSLYAPIRIVAAVVKGFEGLPAVEALRRFLASPDARAIVEKHGL